MIAAISGLPSFLLYFAIAVALVGVYLSVYNFATKHNEFALIRQNVPSAAISSGLGLIGFALPLSSAMVHSRTVLDLIVWGLVAVCVQVVVYFLVRLLVPNLSERVSAGELSSALFLGAASLAAGIINAAAMTY